MLLLSYVKVLDPFVLTAKNSKGVELFERSSRQLCFMMFCSKIDLHSTLMKMALWLIFPQRGQGKRIKIY